MSRDIVSAIPSLLMSRQEAWKKWTHHSGILAEIDKDKFEVQAAAYEGALEEATAHRPISAMFDT
ncbi:MAG TPA: hypothetical protein VG711_06845 [Phycisphaerales bacterium]|nr:hypothetical protein [Phycisphaerales bacterium]